MRTLSLILLLGAPASAGVVNAPSMTVLLQAVADPKVELPRLAESLRASGGRKAARAADSLERLGRRLLERDGQGHSSKAAALLSAFDGGTAAPGERIDFRAIGSDQPGPSEKKALKRLPREIAKMRPLHKLLSTSDRGLFIGIQAIDAAGKDGVVDHGMSGLNPGKIRTTAFKAPSAEEKLEHYLARIRRALGGKGNITIHIRTHYEDLINPLLYKTLPKDQIEKRYKEIIAFERELIAAGYTMLKVFLVIDKEEQRLRLQDRIDKPHKRAKFDMNDLKTRARWNELHRVYAGIIARTSMPYAPWNVIGADSERA
ncbi:MAG: hypothetical protein HYZ74_03495, partial [Elusimicrobia bacterium]|nr:hypothetical protein [Elusimicrobiota bacterium]